VHAQSRRRSMTQTITATFEDGVLKPDAKLSLASGTKVRLLIDSELASDGAQADLLAEWERLCDQAPVCSIEPHLTRDELHDAVDTDVLVYRLDPHCPTV
jgi:predicted DNA-binding antitoxin AbrB/MazE fold protein